MTTTSPDTIRVRTLGAALVEKLIDGEWQQVLGAGKAHALLVYLSAAPRRSARREELVDLLWADRDVPKARSSLRQMMWDIRQRVGLSIVADNDDVIALPERLSVDRDELLVAVAADDAQEVVDRYHGSFLPAIALPGGSEFELWADGERARLRTAFMHAATLLVRRHMDRGRSAEAVELARRLRSEDDSRESAWRLLLEALTAKGDWLATSVEVASLEARLHDEGRDPEPQTRALLKRLHERAKPSSGTDADVLRAELTGREAEFSLLLAAWARARTVRAVHVHLTGVAGIGKTRLLVELQQRLRAQGARVVAIRANPGEQQLAWGVAGDLVANLGARSGASGVPPAVVPDIVELAPALSTQYGTTASRADAHDMLRRRTLATYELLASVAEEAPLAVLVDDMHWADEESRALLFGVLHRLEKARVLVVTTTRPDGRAAFGTAATQIIDIAGLSVAAVHDLVASIARLPALEWARALPGWLHEASGGSPLGVIEALNHAVAAECLAVEDAGWIVRRERDLKDVVTRGASMRDRLNALDAPQREVVVLLAVAGLPLREAVLVRATRAEPAVLVTRLRELMVAGLVRDVAGGWEIAHDRIRDAILADIGDPVARHAQVGEAMIADAMPLLDMRRASMHLRMAGDTSSLAGLARHYLRSRRESGDPRRGRELVAELLGVEEGDALTHSVLSRLPWRVRPRPRAWKIAAVMAGSALALAATAMAINAPHVVMVIPPIAGNPLTPTPVIEARGLTGRRVAEAGLHATVEVASGPGIVTGTTTVPVVNGRAIFSDIHLPASGAYVLRFSIPGYRPVESAPVHMGHLSTLRILHAELNGQAVAGPRPSIVVAPGDPVEGVLELEYSVPWIAGSVFLCGTGSWGDASRSWWRFLPLATPAFEARRPVTMRVVAPAEPGRYRIILALYADRDCDFVMSATNWTAAPPIWGDGNDLAHLSETQLAKAAQSGALNVPQVRSDDDSPPRTIKRADMGIAVIDLVVR